MPLSDSFLVTQGLRLLGGDACARGLIHRRLLPGVCSCCVSRNASVSEARKGLIVTCRDLPITCFLSNISGLVILSKLNTEPRVNCTKFGTCIVMFILHRRKEVCFQSNLNFLKSCRCRYMLTGAKLRDTRIFVKTANVMIRDIIMANHRRDLAIKEATLAFGVPMLIC